MQPKLMLALVVALAVAACAQNHPVAEASAQATARSGSPPVARTVDRVDREFGLTMPDPYRWMEGEDNAEFTAWLHAQGVYARAKLDALPTLESWRKRLAAAAGATTTDRSPTLVGNRLFFLRAAAGKEGVLMVREADGSERTLFDPNAVEGGASIGVYSVSPDDGKVAIGVGLGGNEIGEIEVLDVASGQRLPDTSKPVWTGSSASWLPDGSGFFYLRLHEATPSHPDPMMDTSTWLHRLGQPQSADRLIAQAGADDALKIAAHTPAMASVTPRSSWVMLQIDGAGASKRLCIAPLAHAADRAAWRCPVGDADNVQGFELHGDTLYLLSAKDASNRRVLALDLRNRKATLADAKVVVPERANAVLTGIGVARDGLYVQSMHGGLDHVERLDYAGNALQPVALPGEGSINLMRTDPRQDGALLSLEGWTTPRKVYRYDGHALVDTGLGTRDAPAYPDLVAEEIEATSADGTKVPLSVMRRRDLKLDGHARAVVEGYGGYGNVQRAFFVPLVLEWPQTGNVVAICHVRGGGENGEAWYTGGAGPNKQRGVEDFIACAQELAKRGYSAPSRTGAHGASMGGILLGGAYTTAPQAWGAMTIQVGALNSTRLLAMKNGPDQIPEMGDPRTEAGMKQLLAMDPYQHVRNGVEYPPLLLVTGLVDLRVPPWQSGKFGARVMAASSRTPVWFRTDDQMGHFATNANAMALEYADMIAFFDAYLH